MGKTELIYELQNTLTKIDEHLSSLQERADELGCKLTDISDSSGRAAGIPALIAKAQVLHALSMLEVGVS